MQIAKVAEKYGISQDTLRYYERIGLIPPVTRGTGGIRDYSEEDERWVEFMLCMRGAGLSIEALIEYVVLFRQGDGTRAPRKAILVEQRDVLAAKIGEMQRTLERLDTKIARYDDVLVACENKLKHQKKQY